jgi:hypothetical protein
MPPASSEHIFAAVTGETIGLLTAFAFAVADTHPDPHALSEAFSQAVKSNEDAVAHMPGRTGKEFQQAREVTSALAGAIQSRLIARVRTD